MFSENVEFLSRVGLTPEQERSRVTFLDIFSLTPPEMRACAAEIAAHGGKIRVLVHPHYDKPNSYWTTEEKVKFARYEHGRDRLYATDNKEALPLIIFEEREEIPSTMRVIRTHYTSEKSKTILVVPTEKDSSQPVTQGWDGLIRILERLDVTEIIVGGQNMEITDWLSSSSTELFVPLRQQLRQQGFKSVDSLCFFQCVGTAAKYLALSFIVHVGGIAFPDNRMTLAKRK